MSLLISWTIIISFNFVWKVGLEEVVLQAIYIYKINSKYFLFESVFSIKY
jgi:hypothetical protein